MIRLEPHGPVVRAEFSTARTRLIGITVSCYLHKGVVVDTAFPDVRHWYRDWLTASRAVGVMVTHHHEDHAGNVNSVAKLGLPAWIAPATMARIRDVEPIGFYRHFTWRQMRSLTREVMPFDPAPLVPIATPGHAHDHHVLWDPLEEILFAGDLFLGVKVRVAHADEDPRALVASLRACARLRPRMLFCAHRGNVPEPVAALSAKADWLEHTIGEVDRLADAGWTDAAIQRAVLGREDVTGYFSFGDYSRVNLVKAIRATRAAKTD
ncbi:MAG: MBL fold metallo-hydrolase [Gemmatimonadetes bacterium]|nr:MBL fold metallo-hydrolase [Gemmatimonadota bacterium]